MSVIDQCQRDLDVMSVDLCIDQCQRDLDVMSLSFAVDIDSN